MSCAGRTGTGRGVVAFLVTLTATAALASSASAATYTNPTPFTIPNVGPAAPYPSAITVSGMPGNVVKATATVHGISHSRGHEVDVLLVAPNGARSILFSDVCGGNEPNDVPFGGSFTFDDAAPGFLSGAALTCRNGGTYRPTDAVMNPEDFHAPAPPPPHPVAMATFIGGPANGTWQLFVRDQIGDCGFFCPPGGVGGQISGGWSLELTSPPTCAGQAATRSSTVGSTSADVLIGTPGDDVMVGLGGTDTIRGNGGNDVVCGGEGADTVVGAAGRDTLVGEAGADTLTGGRHKDKLRGGLGKDRLKGGKGKDRCQGGQGKDRLSSC